MLVDDANDAEDDGNFKDFDVGSNRFRCLITDDDDGGEEKSSSDVGLLFKSYENVFEKNSSNVTSSFVLFNGLVLGVKALLLLLLLLLLFLTKLKLLDASIGLV